MEDIERKMDILRISSRERHPIHARAYEGHETMILTLTLLTLRNHRLFSKSSIICSGFHVWRMICRLFSIRHWGKYTCKSWKRRVTINDWSKIMYVTPQSNLKPGIVKTWAKKHQEKWGNYRTIIVSCRETDWSKIIKASPSVVVWYPSWISNEHSHMYKTMRQWNRCESFCREVSFMVISSS